MVIDNREKILQLVKTRGPVLPGQVAKEIGTDMIMASAHLAELTATHKLKISHVKVGGSPVYFLQGQEIQLQKFINGFNDKEKKAYDLLNEKKVLRDTELEPVIRVALRELKDFALPLTVSHNGSSEIFWKWYLAQDIEVEKMIKERLHIAEEKKPIEEVQQNLGKISERPIQKIDKVQEKEKEPKKSRRIKRQENHFLENVMKFFSENKINVISQEVIKKNSEIDFLIEIPSVMGNLKYFCKAKNKKKVNELDLSSALVKAQFRKMPAIFISDGDLTPKANDALRNELNSIAFKKV